MRQSIRFVLLILAACVAHAAENPAPAQSGWRLVWSDEFDAADIDYTKWSIAENGHGGGNNELQYYLDRPENVRVDQGMLVIEARAEKVNIAGVLRDYTSGRVRTKRRASWQYGRFEVRAKVPADTGLWPAIWLLPEDSRYGTWAASGEIDIAEVIGKTPDRVHGSLHYGDVWPNNQSQSAHLKVAEGRISDDFHIFALEWEASELRWYLDGKRYYSTRRWHSTAAPYPAPFNQPFYLILNLAVGGNWPGPPNAQTPFPAQMQVDYVRVYQKDHRP